MRSIKLIVVQLPLEERECPWMEGRHAGGIQVMEVSDPQVESEKKDGLVASPAKHTRHVDGGANSVVRYRYTYSIRVDFGSRRPSAPTASGYSLPGYYPPIWSSQSVSACQGVGWSLRLRRSGWDGIDSNAELMINYCACTIGLCARGVESLRVPGPVHGVFG